MCLDHPLFPSYPFPWTKASFMYFPKDIEKTPRNLLEWGTVRVSVIYEFKDKPFFLSREKSKGFVVVTE